ncbi:MAG: BglII/BstYI family type II restriction endonuclease, partial [Pirellulales bacterium]
MGRKLIPRDIRKRLYIEERRHACAILDRDAREQFSDLIGSLREFELLRSEVIAEGGRKSKIAERFDALLERRGWRERKIRVSMSVDGEVRKHESHKVDFYKNGVAIELEWNNKDPFFARDLNV